MTDTEQPRSSNHQHDPDVDDIRRSNSRRGPVSATETANLPSNLIDGLPSFLTEVNATILALAKSDTPKKLVDTAHLAETMRIYAKLSQFGMAAQNRCAELLVRAERKLGELLLTTLRLHGRPKSVPHENTLPRLSDFGIKGTKGRELFREAQRLAKIDGRDFEAYLQAAHERGTEITIRHLLGHCERRQQATKNRELSVGGRVDDLIEFARAGNRMGCIVLDPPWPVRGSRLPYETMSFDELRDLPIPDLAAERCHLHVWTVPNCDDILTTFELIKHWGFRLVSQFVWAKTTLGNGNYWRMSHENLFTGVRGDNDRFDDRGLRSWIEAPRRRHSEKPDTVRGFIERASPGPRLEIFARKVALGWFAWGHEIQIPLAEQKS